MDRASSEFPARYLMTYFRHAQVTLTMVAGDAFGVLEPRHPHEVFLVQDTWYPTYPEKKVAAYAKLQRSYAAHVWHLSNTQELHDLRVKHGLNSQYVNTGCFVDETLFRPAEHPVTKQYDAVMVARFTTLDTGDELKRHYLAAQVRNLALLDPVLGTNNEQLKQHYCRQPNCTFFNRFRLPHKGVVMVLWRSHSGLFLSALEGACLSSARPASGGVTYGMTTTIHASSNPPPKPWRPQFNRSKSTREIPAAFGRIISGEPRNSGNGSKIRSWRHSCYNITSIKRPNRSCGNIRFAGGLTTLPSVRDPGNSLRRRSVPNSRRLRFTHAARRQ
jgi:hypothetical protein